MVRNRLNANWAAVAKVNFTGWQNCPSSLGNIAAVTIDNSTIGNSDAWGQGTRQVTLGSGRSDFTTSLVPHEFGHVLGFRHEMKRADFQDNFSNLCNESNVAGDNLNTPPDQNSIMASTGYCQENPNISLWDAFGSQMPTGGG